MGRRHTHLSETPPPPPPPLNLISASSTHLRSPSPAALRRPERRDALHTTARACGLDVTFDVLDEG